MTLEAVFRGRREWEPQRVHQGVAEAGGGGCEVGGGDEALRMDKALGSDDVDKLVWVLTCTRSSSAFANRRPQYSVPKNKIFVKNLCIFYFTAMKY